VRDIEFPEEAGVWGPPTVPGTFTLPEPLAFGFLCALYHVGCPHPLWWRHWFRRPTSRERGGPGDIINAVYHCPCCQRDVPHHKQRVPVIVLGGARFECPIYGHMHEAPFQLPRPSWYMHCRPPSGMDDLGFPGIGPTAPFPSYDDQHMLRALEWKHDGWVRLWELVY
jgi:hypothetical protein